MHVSVMCLFLDDDMGWCVHVRSKAVAVLMFLTHCFIYLTLFVGVMCRYLFCYAFLCPFEFCNHLDEEERAGCFALIIFLMSCDW